MARFTLTQHAVTQFIERVQPNITYAQAQRLMQEHALIATRMRITTFAGQIMYRIESPLHAYVVKNDPAYGAVCVTVLGARELSRYDNGGMDALSPEVQAELDGIVDGSEGVVSTSLIGGSSSAVTTSTPQHDAALLGLLAECYVQLSLSTYQSPIVAALKSRMERRLTPEAILEAQEHAGYFESTTATTMMEHAPQ